MLLSGAVAGLVGMPTLLGETHTYSTDFPAGLGFTGIAIALLGRNNPVGIAFGALLLAFLDTSPPDSCDLERRRQGDRRDHPGRHRAVASSSPTSSSAATGSRASSSGSARELAAAAAAPTQTQEVAA